MNDKKEIRTRRATKARMKMASLKMTRLTVHRTGSHIYAQVIDADNNKVLVSASTVESEVRKLVMNGGNISAATLVGKRIAEKAQKLGISAIAFDRSGFRYHGRVRALAEAAREAGLQF